MPRLFYLYSEDMKMSLYYTVAQKTFYLHFVEIFIKL